MYAQYVGAYIGLCIFDFRNPAAVRPTPNENLGYVLACWCIWHPLCVWVNRVGGNTNINQ